VGAGLVVQARTQLGEELFELAVFEATAIDPSVEGFGRNGYRAPSRFTKQSTGNVETKSLIRLTAEKIALT
jgi:hypothetical protein